MVPRPEADQTPSFGLRHPLSSPCRNGFRHKSRKTQLTDSFSLVLKSLMADNSDYIRGFFYNHPCCLRQHNLEKSLESRQNSFVTRGGHAPCLRACFDIVLLSQSYYYLNLSELTNSVGGQLHGDKECPFRHVTNSGRVLEEGAGKRGLGCDG